MSRRRIDEIRRGLLLPALLTEMLEMGRWKHPGDAILRAKVPFIHEPVIFLNSKDNMMLESGPLMNPNENECEMFSEYRGPVIGERDLPWIDVEQTLFMICNKWPGDDVGIALDYRTGINSPRVIGSDWHSSRYCIYRQISPTFEAFVQLLEL